MKTYPPKTFLESSNSYHSDTSDDDLLYVIIVGADPYYQETINRQLGFYPDLQVISFPLTDPPHIVALDSMKHLNMVVVIVDNNKFFGTLSHLEEIEGCSFPVIFLSDSEESLEWALEHGYSCSYKKTNLLTGQGRLLYHYIQQCSRSFLNTRRLEFLDEQNRELRELGRVMGHDLRNHLRAIEGYARLLELGEENEGIFDKIKAQTRKVAELFDHQLVVTEDPHARTNEIVNLKQLMTEVAEVSLPEDVKLMCTQSVSVNAGIQDLHLLFKNLFENAVVHGKASLVEVQFTKKSEHLIMSVSNNGLLLSKEKANQLTLGDGYGIGLHVVRRVLDRHGWGFRVEAAEVETRFLVEIPCEQVVCG